MHAKVCGEVELAAAEIGVDLGRQLHVLWLVLAYLRAPVPHVRSNHDHGHGAATSTSAVAIVLA